MLFFLVTGTIMALSIITIYKLCHYFGLELKWVSLALCALLSFAINGLAIAFSPYLDQSHYMRLAGLVIFAAALVTLLNELLLKREQGPALAANGPENVPILLEEEDAPLQEEAQSEPLAKQFAEPEPALTDSGLPQPSITAPEPIVPELPNVTAMVPDSPPEPGDTVMSADAVAAANAEARAKLSARLMEAMKANQPRPKPAIVVEDEEPAEEIDLPPEKDGEKQPEDFREEVEKRTSINALLDYAYERKDEEPSAAIMAYRSAIERFPEDDYTPFLCIELAGLYKENALYQEAIDLYKDALVMPIIASNDAAVHEFERSLRYLGTVQDILRIHHELTTPFSQLSPEILQEIEAAWEENQ